MSSRSSALAAGLFGLMLCAGLLPQASGPLAPFIIDDLSLSAAQFGILPAAYYLGAMLTSLPASGLVAGYGLKRVLAIFSTLQVMGLVAIGLYGDRFEVLTSAFFVSGVFAGSINPISNGIIGMSPVGLRTLVGLRQSGIPAAALVGGAVLAPLSGVWSWRPVLASTSLLVVPVMASIFYGVSHSPRQRGTTRAATRRTPRDLSGLCLFAFAALMAMGQGPVTQFSVLYLSSASVGMPVAIAGALFGFMGLVGLPGRLVWAAMFERGLSAQASLTVSCVGSIVAVLALMLADGPHVALAVGAMVLMGVFMIAWMVIANISIVHYAPDRSELLTGFLYTGFYLGLLISAPMFGLLLEVTHGYFWGWAFALVCMALGLSVLISTRRTLLRIKMPFVIRPPETTGNTVPWDPIIARRGIPERRTP